MRNGDRVVALRPVEEVSINADCLVRLREVGRGGLAAKMIGESLEDLALGLSRAARAYCQDRFEDIIRECLDIARIAGRIGLDRMARVALTVAALVKGSDGVALAANLARLTRIGNDALGEIWDLHGQIV